MRKLTGFMMFFIGIGLIISCFIESTFVKVLIIIILMLCGYHLVSSRDTKSRIKFCLIKKLCNVCNKKSCR
ncbi:MAG: hypothetical protein K6G26_13540 [Lachnospiraceae bacterium]|nr:hypothetical protein [Lachnospiraceae bacterium]